jgi:Cof subfamily protein (haloacid dehalogenase superfamily)
MPKYKLLVVDIDGTIIDINGAISDEDKTALAAASASGVRVCLSTGRVVSACRRILNSLALGGCHIFYDGALVCDAAITQEIYCSPLEAKDVQRAVEFTRSNDIYLELYTTERFFAERPNWSDEIHTNYFGVAPMITNLSGIWERERIIKAEILVRDAVEQEQADYFRSNFDGSFRFSIARSPSFPGIDFINIINPCVSKGVALKALAAHHDIAMEEVIAIGDGLNDISLLETAGTAVAMGNAFPEVKKVADYITLDVKDSGVAVVVWKFLG